MRALVDFVRSFLVGFGLAKGRPATYTETELWEIAEGRRLHWAAKSTFALFAVWVSIHLIFGWTNHWSFYLILAIAALGHYIHCRLRALCQLLRGERQGNSSQHTFVSSSQPLS